MVVPMARKSSVPLRRTCGISALLPALAGAFVALLLVVAPPPAEAGAVQVGGPASDIEGAPSNLLKRAEEIEAELARRPDNEALLAQLTRTRINAANTLINDGAGESTRGVAEWKKQLALGRVAWSEYLKVARKPGVALATLVAPALFELAELSSNSQEALKNVRAAVRAQKIVTEGRPGKNSWSTLAFYELFAQDHKAADESIEKAIVYTKTKYECEAIEKQFKEVEKAAKQFGRELKAR
jgi:hypothetical protein